MSELPAVNVPLTAETESFWSNVADGQLVVPRCLDCDKMFWYPRRRCPECHGSRIRWEPVSGKGHIYSFTIVRYAVGDFSPSAPYVLAYVDLEEGPRLLTNVIGVSDFSSLAVGQAVSVVLPSEAAGDGAAIRFTVAAGRDGSGGRSVQRP